MQPIHSPDRCNYPHTEVIVFKEQNGKREPQETIKPGSVKLRIREDVGNFLTIALPLERSGNPLPLEAVPKLDA